MGRSITTLESMKNYVDAFPNWRTEKTWPADHVRILMSLAVRGELEKHIEREAIERDRSNPNHTIGFELIDLVTTGVGHLSREDLIRLRDGAHREATRNKAHATLAGLLALKEDRAVDPKLFDFGRPHEPRAHVLGEARYLCACETFEEDDLAPWAYLVELTTAMPLVPVGLRMARQFGVSFGELLRDALQRIDDDLYLDGRPRLDAVSFSGRLTSNMVELRVGLRGSGGELRAGLGCEMAVSIHSGMIDSLLVRQAAIKNLGKGASLPKLRKVLANPDSVVRKVYELTGDVSASEAAIAPYRRRLEALHAWTKAVNPEIQAGIELVIES